MPLSQLLQELIESGLERNPRAGERRPHGHLLVGGRDCLDFSSNDYLGLAAHPRLAQALIAATREGGVGATSARLLSGSRPEHHRLEQQLADLTGKEAALLFNSGYHANLGILPALTRPGSLIFSDQLNHASIVDGCRLAPARTIIYPHCDHQALARLLDSEERAGALRPDCPHFLVTEGLFSMDGDHPDLPALVALKERFGLLLLLDDAHGFGALGEQGLGSAQPWLPKVDLLVVTFGKATGVAGAAVAGTQSAIRLLRSRSRPFIFSTALPPAVAAAATESLELSAGDEGRNRRQLLARNCRLFRAAFAAVRPEIDPAGAQIVPVAIGDEAEAVAAAIRLEDAGIFCRAIRYPTVARGAARLRFSLSADHRPEELVWAAAAVADLLTPFRAEATIQTRQS